MVSKIISLLFLVTSLNACGQVNSKNISMSTENSIANVSVFIASFAEYSMDIQAAGMASISKATVSEKGELYIEYVYESGTEKRNGKMTLYAKGDNRYEGNWETDADNGNSYQGVLYFVFNKLGTAHGYYQFGGSDYKITIIKNKE